ncbi:hypothetical protein [Sandaracinus amylolyticus]|uniref:hypothetical protein n=1 Tax=Sandaracinus amylolyticus TaxID=927083 RepID=UPI001F232F50|nr:hypothetical protein [Sandaracinus amylolyticus]UJR78566.1 Hypothetical protein I5071_5960 [Sandaracinus amylolyticus]
MDPNALLAGRTRETKIRRDARGRWFDGADPIDHVLLTQAFDAWIDRADDGRYCLKNDINWAYVTIEGAPIFVRTIEREGDVVWLQLSDGRREPLDPSTLREDREGALHAQVRGGTLAARFDVHAAMQLEPLIAEDERGAHLVIAERVVRPPVVDDPIAWPL